MDKNDELVSKLITAIEEQDTSSIKLLWGIVIAKDISEQIIERMLTRLWRVMSNMNSEINFKRVLFFKPLSLENFTSTNGVIHARSICYISFIRSGTKEIDVVKDTFITNEKTAIIDWINNHIMDLDTDGQE